MSLDKKLIYMIYIFLIGGFTGFLYEVIFYYLEYGYFINSGILYGVITPIYGIGAILLYYFKKFRDRPILLFGISLLLTGIIEYVIGYVAFNFLDLKLWNYDNSFLNISGIVCLRSVLIFASGSLLLHYVVIPTLDKIFKKINFKYLKGVAFLAIILFMIDIILSILFRTPKTF